MEEIDHENPVVQLARYDTQNVADQTLAKLFQCSLQDLAEVRASADYKEAHAAFIKHEVDGRQERNEAWDNVESIALGGLQETLGMTTDPRMLLAAAKTANQATRAQAAPEPVIDMGAREATRTTVIRLRSSFTAALQEPNGTRTIVQREEVTQLEQSVGSDRIPSAKSVETLMEKSLGVKVSEGMPRDARTDPADLLDLSPEDYEGMFNG